MNGRQKIKSERKSYIPVKRGKEDSETNKREHPAVTFLKKLYERCDTGSINIRLIPPKKNLFLELTEIDLVPDLLEKFVKEGVNAYFAVATRINNDGTKEGICQVPAVWLDLDCGNTPLRVAWKRIRKFRLIPSAIIATSLKRLHLYWFLREPATREQITDTESILKRLAHHLGGDSNVTDASHCLRIPGSQNFKRKGFIVQIKEFRPDIRYSLKDFRFLEPIEEEKKADVKPIGWADKIMLNGIPQGERNSTITKLAGRYIQKGLSKVETKALLSQANGQSNPPLGDREVDKILDSVIKTNARKNAGQEKKVEEDCYHITTVDEILAYPELTYVAKPIVPEGMVLMVAGDPGSAKSLVSLTMIKAVVAGGNVWGKYPVIKMGPVLLVDEDTPRSLLRERITKMKFKGFPIHALHFEKVRLDTKKGFEKLMRTIEKINPVLVVIDCLTRVHRRREYDPTSISKVMNRLRDIANWGTTVWVIHHLSKRGTVMSQKKVRGSTDIVAEVDMAYLIRKVGDNMILESVKARMEQFEAINLKLKIDETSINVSYQGIESMRVKLVVGINNILKKEGESGIDEIYELLIQKGVKVGKGKLRKTLDEGVGKQYVVRTGPRNKNLYRLAQPSNDAGAKDSKERQTMETQRLPGRRMEDNEIFRGRPLIPFRGRRESVA